MCVVCCGLKVAGLRGENQELRIRYQDSSIKNRCQEAGGVAVSGKVYVRGR